jgi:hypothetical protein
VIILFCADGMLYCITSVEIMKLFTKHYYSYLAKENVIGCDISLKNKLHGFSKDVFLHVTPEFSTDTMNLERNVEFWPEKHTISDVFNIMYEDADNILKNLCYFNNLIPKTEIENFAAISSLRPEGTEFLIKLLRNRFFYCTICCRAYDNAISMVFGCSNHSINDYCHRKIELAQECKIF